MSMTEQLDSRSGSRPARSHEPWERLVSATNGDMNGEELASLTWPTVKDLARYYGLIKPMEMAHIELAWQERHITMEEQVTRAKLAIEREEEERKAAEAAAAEAARLEAEAAKKAPYAKPTLKGRTSLLSRGKSSSPTRVTKERVPLRSTRTTRVSGEDSSTPVKQKTTAETRGMFQSPLQVAAPADVERQAAPKGAQFADPTNGVERSASPQSRNPDVHGQTSRIDTGVARSSSNSRREMQENICIQDLRAVFDKYTRFGGGSEKEGIDSTRFAKLCKECNLIDKVFTVREADVLFQRCKMNQNDRRMPYHHFRMRLVPELAGRKRCTINDIVRICNYRVHDYEKQRQYSAVDRKSLRGSQNRDYE